eukprot:7961687-Alexandrium_andersonii.AAC.1
MVDAPTRPQVQYCMMWVHVVVGMRKCTDGHAQDASGHSENPSNIAENRIQRTIHFSQRDRPKTPIGATRCEGNGGC